MKSILGNLIDIVPVVPPLDLGTARSGDYISLKNCQGVAFVFFKGVGTAADDPTLTFRQAKDVAGTDVKDLVAVSRISKKQATALTALGVWSNVTQTPAATFVGDGTSAEEQGLYVVEIPTEMLDVDNGFDCVTVNIGDVGANAQLGCVLAILYGLRYPSAPASLPNAIA